MKKVKLIILVFVLLVTSVLVVFVNSYKTTYLSTIKLECKNYNLDENLILGIIKAESKFKVNSVSNANAKGLMQILPSTGEWIAKKLSIQNYKEEDLFDYAINIKFGCYYVRYLLNYYNQNEKLSICAYNAGMGIVDSWLENSDYSKNGELTSIPYNETKKYLKKVQFNKSIYALFIIK